MAIPSTADIERNLECLTPLGLRFLFPIKKIVSKMIDFDKSKCFLDCVYFLNRALTIFLYTLRKSLL
jgi:hypothetical protein